MKKLVSMLLVAVLLQSLAASALADWTDTPWLGGKDLRQHTSANPSNGFPTGDHPAPRLIQKIAVELPTAYTESNQLLVKLRALVLELSAIDAWRDEWDGGYGFMFNGIFIFSSFPAFYQALVATLYDEPGWAIYLPGSTFEERIQWWIDDAINTINFFS